MPIKGVKEGKALSQNLPKQSEQLVGDQLGGGKSLVVAGQKACRSIAVYSPSHDRTRAAVHEDNPVAICLAGPLLQ